MSSLSSSLMLTSFSKTKRPRISTHYPHPHSYQYSNPHPVTSNSASSNASSTSSTPSSSRSNSSSQSSKSPRKKRTTPCERCRRIRKRCDFSIPCKRCSNACSECIYVSARSRAEKDREGVVIYEEVFDDVEDVQLGVEEMEKEVHNMREIVASTTNASSSPPPPDLPSDKVSPPRARDDDGSLSPESSYTNSPNINIIINNNNSSSDSSIDIFKYTNDGCHFVKSLFIPDSPTSLKAWTLQGDQPALSIKVSFQASAVKNEIRLKTNINTLEGLSVFLSNGMTSSPLNEKNFLSSDPINLSAGQLWRQFTWYFTSKLYIEDRPAPVRRLILPDETSSSVPYRLPRHDLQDDVRRVTSHLLDVYFRCTNEYFPLLHKQTFYDRYFDRHEPTRSAVVCALSAWMMTQRCSHLFPAPVWNMTLQARQSWGKYYHNRAKDVDSDIFDQPCYDNFLYQVFMTQYLMGSRMYPSAEAHVMHAYRIAEILVINYKENAKRSDLSLEEQIEGETFKRVAIYAVGLQRALVLIMGQGRFGCIGEICYVVGNIKVLPVEDSNSTKNWITLMNHLIGLDDILTGIQMRAKTIPVDDFPQLEKILKLWWSKIPKSLMLREGNHLSDFAPLDAPPLNHAEILFAQICMNYHSCWIMMHSRLLPDKNLPDTFKHLPPSGASFEECSGPGGGRSIEICKDSARTITSLAEQLERNSPCHFDYHALPQAHEVHTRLARLDPSDHLTKDYREKSKALVDMNLIDKLRNGAAADHHRTMRERVTGGELIMGGGWIVGGADSWSQAV